MVIYMRHKFHSFEHKFFVFVFVEIYLLINFKVPNITLVVFVLCTCINQQITLIRIPN